MGARSSLPTPHEMVRYVSRFVHAQEPAKRELAQCIYRHYAAMAYRVQHPNERYPFGKRHALLLGPTGSGKTYLVSRLAEFLGVPLAFTNATSLVETGYVGEHTDSIFRRLLIMTRGDVEMAERGIVYLDEIDKVRRQDVGGQRDVSGEGVQTGLLAPLDGCPVDVRSDHGTYTIDSGKILFICTGAFSGLPEIIRGRLSAGSAFGFRAADSDFGALTDDELLAQGELRDLQEYGFLPEFLGRFAVITTVRSLSRADLITILRDAEDSPWRRQQRWFEQHGLRLTATEETLGMFADLAIRNNTNARGLERIINKTLGRLDWQLSVLMEAGIGEIRLTPEAVLGKQKPEFIKSAGRRKTPPIEALRAKAATLLYRGRSRGKGDESSESPEIPAATKSSSGLGRKGRRPRRGTKNSKHVQFRLPFPE